MAFGRFAKCSAKSAGQSVEWGACTFVALPASGVFYALFLSQVLILDSFSFLPFTVPLSALHSMCIIQVMHSTPNHSSTQR